MAHHFILVRLRRINLEYSGRSSEKHQNDTDQFWRVSVYSIPYDASFLLRVLNPISNCLAVWVFLWPVLR
jgi:hypothetical protein